MKTVKRLVAIMMCVVLAAGCLSGCGAMSDEEVLMSSVANINKAKSFDMNAKMTGKMTVGAAGTTQEIEMNSDITSTQFSDPLKAKVTVSQTISGATTTQESYVQKEGDEYVIYTSVSGEWSKMSLGNLEEALASTGANSVQSQLSEDIGKYTKKEDVKENDKSYLVYDYTISSEEVKDMMKGMTSSLGSLLGEGEESEMMSEILDTVAANMGEIKMTVLIDRDTQMIYRVEYPMTDLMNGILGSLMEKIAEMAKEEAGSGDSDSDDADISAFLDQMKMEVSDMKMVATYSNIDNAADFEIPKEALDAESLDATDSGDNASAEDDL